MLLFAGVFATARFSGLGPAIAVTMLVALSRLVLPTAVAPDGSVDPSAMLDVVLDLVAGAAAIAMSLVVERTSRRLRASDLTAEERAGELERLVLRDAAVRSLAQESATPQSVRQLADRFARQARSMVAADGVAVLAGPPSSARAAGGPSDAPLAVDGRAPEPGSIERWVEEAARTGRPVRPDDALFVLPLLAGTGSLAVAAIAMPHDRPLEDEELEGLLLLGRIIGEAMARSELAAVSRRDAGRASGAAERIGRLQALAASLGRELDGEAIARLVVDAASDGTNSSVGVLSRVDGDRAELELLHARGYPVGLLERERRLPLHASLPAPTVARTGRAIRVDAAGWTAEFPGASDLPTMAGLGQVVALPVGGATPLAVLVVGRAGTAAYDDDDIGFLDAVAEHAAQALRRAVLVDLLRDRDRRLGLTLGVARAGTWEMDVETRRFEVSSELRRLYGIADDAPLGTLDAYLEHVHEEDRRAVREGMAGPRRRVAHSPWSSASGAPTGRLSGCWASGGRSRTRPAGRRGSWRSTATSPRNVPRRPSASASWSRSARHDACRRRSSASCRTSSGPRSRRSSPDRGCSAARRRSIPATPSSSRTSRSRRTGSTG